MSQSVSEERFSSRKHNCLNFIRIFAALQVAFKHLVTHLGIPAPVWLMNVIGFFGGVPIFFAISGLLIWFSIERTENYKFYIKKRFLRIYPELWVGVLIEIATILIFYREWKPLSLLAFTFTQGTFLQFWTPDSLQSYGCGAPNGALWTIGITIQFYFVVWFFFKLMHKKKVIHWIIGFLSSIFVSWAGGVILTLIGNEILLKLFSQTVFRYFWIFFIGCFIAEFYDRMIPIISRFWFVFLAIGAIPCFSGFGIWLGNYDLLWALPLCVGIIGFAFKFPKIKLKTDISYGLFIYHMIITNVFISLGFVGDWRYLVGVMILSCLIAYVSTLTVGRFADLKKQKS